MFALTTPTWRLLDRQMDSMLRELAHPTFWTEPFGPQVHVTQTDDGIRLVAELPGLSAEEVEIAATRDTLSLKANRKVKVPEDKKVLRRERKDLQFDATYRFERAIDPDKVTAKVQDGILTITAPLAADLQPKRITIQAK